MRDKILKITSEPCNDGSVTRIKVSGNWLEKMGYQYGNYIHLVATPESIVIKRCEHPERRKQERRII